MLSRLKRAYEFIAATVSDFIADDCMSMAAALAYYTVFSLPPLLVLVISIAGAIYNRNAVHGEVHRQLESMIGPEVARQIEGAVEKTQAGGSGTLATVLGLVVLIVGASGVLAQLQYALNRAWEVEPDPERNGWKDFFLKRVLSLAMILAIAFLLLVSLVVSAALAAFGGVLGQVFSSEYIVPVLRAANFGVSLLVITFLFAAMYKLLPDVKISWRDVWIGSFVTAILFVAGKALIGVYLGSTNVASAYGAAGALAILLIWIYYASLIVLYGAEFTQVWARRHGGGLEPVEGAVRTVHVKQHLPGDRGSALAKEHRGNQSA